MKSCHLFFAMIAALFFCVFSNGYAAQKNLNIALLLWRGETAAEKGFKQELSEQGYTVSYQVYDAAQDRNKLADMVRRKISFDQFDYVYTFGTTISKTVVYALQNKTPQVFNIVADPVGAGIVKDLNATGANISGVTNAVPLELQIENSFKAVAFQKLGVFFNPREKNSVLIKEQLTALGKQMNFIVVPLRSPPEGDLFEANINGLVDKSIGVDAVYFPTDSFLVSKAEYIGHQMRQAKMVSIGAIKKFIDSGVMLGTVTDYGTLGKMAADIIDQHQKGKHLSDIPVQVQKEPVLVINKKTVDLLKIKIDPVLLGNAMIVE